MILSLVGFVPGRGTGCLCRLSLHVLPFLSSPLKVVTFKPHSQLTPWASFLRC